MQNALNANDQPRTVWGVLTGRKLVNQNSVRRVSRPFANQTATHPQISRPFAHQSPAPRPLVTKPFATQASALAQRAHLNEESPLGNIPAESVLHHLIGPASSIISLLEMFKLDQVQRVDAKAPQQVSIKPVDAIDVTRFWKPAAVKDETPVRSKSVKTTATANQPSNFGKFS